MLRPNPRVTSGRIASALAGAAARWEGQGVALQGQARVEVPFVTPDDQRFVQTTVGTEVAFRALADHRFTLRSHVLVTSGGAAPPQRYSYLGGAGTLPTFDLLTFGGDQLLFLESGYAVPIERFAIPFLGVPTVSLRHAFGAAGSGRLPPLEQNVGLRLDVGLLRAQFMVDPASGKSAFTVGFAAS